MKIIKWIATIIDLVVGMSLLIAALNDNSNYSSAREEHIILSLFVMLLVILNIFSIWPNVDHGDSWISLYIQRKKLEERKRMKDINT